MALGAREEGAATGLVKSANRTLDIIELVAAQGRPLVAKEISVALSIPVSSLSYLLNTLVERAYLERQGRKYALGRGVHKFRSGGGASGLADRAGPLVRSICQRLNETTSFFVRRCWEVEAVATETGQQALRYAVNVGARVPIHALAAGKAILASLPDAEIDRFFAETALEPVTDRTILDEASLRRQLAEIRIGGIARSGEEYSPGVHALAVPVTSGGGLLGALSVAVPTPRFTSEVRTRIADILRDGARFLAD
jgi:IclR family acetate operon transcriptional repressor